MGEVLAEWMERQTDGQLVDATEDVLESCSDPWSDMRTV